MYIYIHNRYINITTPNNSCFYGDKLFDILLCTVRTKGFYDCFYGYFPYIMDKKMNKVSCDKTENFDDVIDNLNSDKNVTEEEFQNFMHRVTEVGECYSSDRTIHLILLTCSSVERSDK